MFRTPQRLVHSLMMVAMTMMFSTTGVCCAAEPAVADTIKLSEGWHRGPLPTNTYGWGAVVLEDKNPKDGFYFADFAGSHVHVLGNGGRMDKRVEANEVAYWNNSIKFPIFAPTKTASDENRLSDTVSALQESIKNLEKRLTKLEESLVVAPAKNAPIVRATPPCGWDAYNAVRRSNKKGDLTEAEYKFIRDNMPLGDGLRNLSSRELEAIDPSYRQSTDVDREAAYERRDSYQEMVRSRTADRTGSNFAVEDDLSVRRYRARVVYVTAPYDGSTPKKKVTAAPPTPTPAPTFKLPPALLTTTPVQPVAAGACTGPNCGAAAGGPIAEKVRALFHWRPLARRSRGCRGC